MAARFCMSFERLGRGVSRELDHELRRIVSEKGLREEDPFEEIVADAVVLDVSGRLSFAEALAQACAAAAARIGVAQDDLVRALQGEQLLGLMPISDGSAVPHLRVGGAFKPVLVMVRARDGISIEVAATSMIAAATEEVFALVRRMDDTYVPRSGDVFRPGDRLTVIGEPDAIEAVRARFAGAPASTNSGSVGVVR